MISKIKQTPSQKNEASIGTQVLDEIVSYA